MHVHLLSMTIRRVDVAVHAFVQGFIFQIADGFRDGGALPASITKTCACTAARHWSLEFIHGRGRLRRRRGRGMGSGVLGNNSS
jgi:hypothetical protein